MTDRPKDWQAVSLEVEEKLIEAEAEIQSLRFRCVEKNSMLLDSLEEVDRLRLELGDARLKLSTLRNQVRAISDAIEG